MPKKFLPYLTVFVGGFFLLLDQGLKQFAHSHPEFTWYLIEPWLGWEYFENTGVAFSLPLPQTLLVIGTPLILLALAISFLRKKNRPPLFQLAMTLLIFGAVSNYIDRILFGVTIDYLRIVTGVINLADVAIVVGVLLLIFQGTKQSPPLSDNKSPF